MTSCLQRLIPSAVALAAVVSWQVFMPTLAEAGGKVLDPDNLDRSHSPRDDFYRFANGGWLKHATIPADRGRWGAFDELSETVGRTLRDLAEGVVLQNPTVGTVEQKVADFYQAGMDVQAIEEAGVAPLAPALALVQGVVDPNSLAEVLAQLHQSGHNAFFGVNAWPDAKDSGTVILQLTQGGLSLSTPDDYLAADRADRRETFLHYAANMFGLLGHTAQQAENDAATVLRIETALARHSLSPQMRRDPVATYNVRNLQELEHEAPGFSWDVYFSRLDAKYLARINLEHPPFFTTLAQLVENMSFDDLRVYLTWNVLNHAAPYLSDAFVQERFAFYGKYIAGMKELPERYKRVLHTVDGCIGEALGEIYVGKVFSSDARERALRLVDDLRYVLSQRIKSLPWMDASTRAQALQKLERLTVKVGYPDAWIDYSNLAISRGYLVNVLAANAFNFSREMTRLGQAPDRSRWLMTPQTVNAYFEPALNEIVFPAAILQYPFFDAQADDAFNYGAIGGVIGHELTHGFDDQGRQFDADGNLRDWWTAADAAAFTAQADLIVGQFDSYTIFDKHLRGALTQGENLADLGGCKLAFQALQEALQRSGRPAAIDGFEPEQRFFLAWAQVWRNQVRKELAWELVDTDPHSPGVWRTNGPLANMRDFYNAFDVKAGDGMYRPEATRVTLW